MNDICYDYGNNRISKEETKHMLWKTAMSANNHNTALLALLCMDAVDDHARVTVTKYPGRRYFGVEFSPLGDVNYYYGISFQEEK